MEKFCILKNAKLLPYHTIWCVYEIDHPDLTESTVGVLHTRLFVFIFGEKSSRYGALYSFGAQYKQDFKLYAESMERFCLDKLTCQVAKMYYQLNHDKPNFPRYQGDLELCEVNPEDQLAMQEFAVDLCADKETKSFFEKHSCSVELIKLINFRRAYYFERMRIDQEVLI